MYKLSLKTICSHSLSLDKIKSMPTHPYLICSLHLFVSCLYNKDRLFGRGSDKERHQIRTLYIHIDIHRREGSLSKDIIT